VSNENGVTLPASAEVIDDLEELGFPQDGTVSIVVGGKAFCLTTDGWELEAATSTPVEGACV
jgi:hypothetical protein